MGLSKKRKSELRERKFMIVFNDGTGLFVPMTEDPDCEGAVCSAGEQDLVALFSSRKAARTAIEISTLWARLQKIRNRPFVDDFIGYRQFVKIVPCEYFAHEQTQS